MNQQTDETIQQYYVRLHEQAVKCQFPDVDLAIQQQIKLCTTNTKLRKYSFQNPKKSLQELLSIAKTFKSMKIQTEEIENSTTVDAQANVLKSTYTSSRCASFPYKQTKPQLMCF